MSTKVTIVLTTNCGVDLFVPEVWRALMRLGGYNLSVTTEAQS